MNVGQLIRYLQNYNEDLEIRIAYQPHYPLQVGIANVTALSEVVKDDDKCRCDCDAPDCTDECDCGGDCNKSEPVEEATPDIIYITSGSSPRSGEDQNDSPYASRKLWSDGW